MKKILATAGVLASVAASTVYAQGIEITHGGQLPTRPGDPSQFSGNVSIDALTTKGSAAFAGSGLVAFAPGARTAWHSHPAGQWLYVTVGNGWVQQEGQAVQALKAGDAVWIPAGVKHWHGATEKNAMSHVAVTPHLDGKNVAWMEQVSDADYGKR